MLIPLSEAAKTKGDVVSVGGAIVAFFKVIPWPEIAGALSCLYLGLRIVEMVVGWFRKRGS